MICETGQVIWQLHGEVARAMSDQLTEAEMIATLHIETARSAARKAYAPYSKFQGRCFGRCRK